ncbi:MAG: histidine phosphatase family protein [Myxococcota bacterium]
MNQTWIFIRHGESTANARRVLSGWQDVALTPLGRTQARRAGRALAARVPKIDRVLSSDLRRAVNTARLALENYPRPTPTIQIDARLRERNMGDLQGQSIDKLQADGRMRQILGWDNAPPGGERLVELSRRCLAALIAQDPVDTTIVFAHGGVIRALIGMADGLRTQQITSRRVENAKLMTRTLPVNGWREIQRQYGYDKGLSSY